AKEALSKVLTTGLMRPFQLYNLAVIRCLDSGIWLVLLEDFALFKLMVSIDSSYALVIVLPTRSVLCLQDHLGEVLQLDPPMPQRSSRFFLKKATKETKA